MLAAIYGGSAAFNVLLVFPPGSLARWPLRIIPVLLANLMLNLNLTRRQRCSETTWGTHRATGLACGAWNGLWIDEPPRTRVVDFP